MSEDLGLLRPISTKTKSNLEASAPGRLPGRFFYHLQPTTKRSFNYAIIFNYGWKRQRKRI